jgi:hypothetical protein
MSNGDMTTVTSKGALGQLGDSFKGMLIGLLCFVISFPVLWHGANRIQWNKVYKNATPIEQAKTGVPSWITGVPVFNPIGDPPYLAAGKYLQINKTPQYYAWVEETKTEKKKEGTTEKTITTYSYVKQWVSDPKDTGSFNEEKWKLFCRNNGINPLVKNPVKDPNDANYKPVYAQNVKVGNYSFKPEETYFYGGSKDLKTVYFRNNTPAEINENSALIGDKRVKYTGYPVDGDYTFIGEKKGANVAPFYATDTESRLAAGPGDFAKLMADIKSSDKLAGMMWFFGGFILMAMGLMMLVGPITKLLEFIPFVGGMGAGLIKFVLALVAFILSVVIWWVAKLWWVILIVMVAGIAYGIYKKKAASPAQRPSA